MTNMNRKQTLSYIQINKYIRNKYMEGGEGEWRDREELGATECIVIGKSTSNSPLNVQ